MPYELTLVPEHVRPPPRVIIIINETPEIPRYYPYQTAQNDWEPYCFTNKTSWNINSLSVDNSFAPGWSRSLLLFRPAPMQII